MAWVLAGHLVLRRPRSFRAIVTVIIRSRASVKELWRDRYMSRGRCGVAHSALCSHPQCGSRSGVQHRSRSGRCCTFDRDLPSEDPQNHAETLWPSTSLKSSHVQKDSLCTMGERQREGDGSREPRNHAENLESARGSAALPCAILPQLDREKPDLPGGGPTSWKPEPAADPPLPARKAH